MAHVKFNADSKHDKGQAIHEQEIDDVLGLYPIIKFIRTPPALYCSNVMENGIFL